MTAPQPAPVFVEQVETLLRTRHAGQGNAALTRDLLEELTGSPQARAHLTLARHLRTAIEEINLHRGGLVCSDTVHGYWWGDCLADLRAVEAHIRRAQRQLRNASALKRNLQRETGGQTRFE